MAMGREIALFLLLTSLFQLHLCQQLGRLDKTGCGDGKVCLFDPNDCDPQVDGSCAAAVTISAAEEAGFVDVMLQRRTTTGAHYVAIAFSKDKKMGDDAVTQCINPGNGQAVIGLSSNPSYSNNPLPGAESGVIDLRGTKVLGPDFICHIRQKLRPSTNSPTPDTRIFDLDQFYYILLAYGSASGNRLAKHGNTPVVSADEYNVSSMQSVAGSGGISAAAQTRLKKAHGIMMICGWWFFVTAAIFFARYFRPMWPKLKPLGKPIWFQSHRALNLFGVLLIAAAFICIFIAKQGEWRGKGTHPGAIHSILGMTCSVLAFFQPLLALIRPHPDGKFRWLFNWVHRFLGVAGWVIAAATIWQATFFGYLSYETWGHGPRGMVIFFYVSVVVAVVVLEIMLVAIDKLHCIGDKPTNQIQMDPKDATPQTLNEPPPFSLVRIGVLLLILLIALAVVITLCCFIGLKK